MATPYYVDDFVTLYHGDCREILPSIGAVETLITDPVWPNSIPELVGGDRPYELFHEMINSLSNARRVVVHLGCDSDPVFLTPVAKRWPFLRTCWLRYACPSYKGRILYSGDVAYAYGEAPPSRRGRHVICGEVTSTKSDAQSGRKQNGKHKSNKKFNRAADTRFHLCPRRLQHVSWLISNFVEQSVCDPFSGSGTTLLAAKEAGLPSIGIEIEERYCEMAAQRLRQEVIFRKGAA